MLLRAAWSLYWSVEYCFQRFGRQRFQPALHGTERPTFLEAFCRHFPVTNALEIGAAYGQNFYHLARLIPQARFVGIELDPETVTAANAVLKQNKITNAVIEQGDAADLKRFPDHSFDVVYAIATLLYIDDQTISSVVREMLRLARKRIILLEPNLENPFHLHQDLGIKLPKYNFLGVYWARDYQVLFSQAAPQAKISATKLSRSLWPNEAWSDLGTIIEIELPQGEK